MQYANVFFLTASMTIFSACTPADKPQIAPVETPQDQNIKAIERKVAYNTREPDATQFREIKLVSDGKAICGQINLKNAYGGYDGFKPFGAMPDGKLYVLHELPLVEVGKMAAMTQDERKNYVVKYGARFMALGQHAEVNRLFIDALTMNEFQYWSTCFADTTPTK